MTDRRYDIVFNGVVRPGYDGDLARANLARLFKAPRERIDRLFSGREVVIKSAVDQATAEKYRSAMHRAGVFCRIRPLGGVSEDAPGTAAGPPASGAAESAGTATPGGLSTAEPGAYLYEPEATPAPPPPDTSHLSAAELGVDLTEPDEVPPPPAPDVSHLSAAEPGTDLTDAEDAPPPPPPDTSHLSAAEPGADLTDADDAVPPPPPDTSHLSTAEPGADLADTDDAAPPPPPDTSHLTLIDDDERG